jgi:hypothetical protein
MTIKITRFFQQSLSVVVMLALVFGSMNFATLRMPVAYAQTSPLWDTTGNYVLALNYLGTDYLHDMTLTQNATGTLSGSGGSPSGANVYTWVLTSGAVSGNTIDFLANYTGTPDAVTPQTVMHATGTIALDGSMSGTWSDNYAAGVRSGTWHSTVGVAHTLLATLAPEDFGVVNYDSGLGQIKGYTAGFGLTHATFAGAQSVVVSLYASGELLQTNTATAKVGVDIVGAQISSPFDVSGGFDYATDGYWVNTRSAEFGQHLAATRVVATVTLADGQIVTAENTSLVGNPMTIMPAMTSAVPTPTGISPLNGSATTSLGQQLVRWSAVTNSIGGITYVYQAAHATSTLADGSFTSPVYTSGALTEASIATVGTPDGIYYWHVQATDASSTKSAWSTTSSFIVDSSGVTGTIGGDVSGGTATSGILQVTSIDAINLTAIANGTFGSGWKYVFHITIPDNEKNVAMKFANWANTLTPSAIAAAGNIRISSAQADNNGAFVVVALANTYTTPALHMTSDLSTSTPGMQVDITVDAAVPVGTLNGTYNTNYGVLSLP